MCVWKCGLDEGFNVYGVHHLSLHLSSKGLIDDLVGEVFRHEAMRGNRLGCRWVSMNLMGVPSRKRTCKSGDHR